LKSEHLGYISRKGRIMNFVWKGFVILGALFLFFSDSLSSSLYGEEVQIKIQKVSSSPKIDGFLEKSFWREVKPCGDFVQYDPFNGNPPSEKTIVYIAYDEDNLYIGFNCLDSQPKKIIGDLTPREAFVSSANDYVAVYIDTYFDKRNFYSFVLNPRGVQIDRPGNYLWQSGAAVNEDGWSAELRIPFKSIRFPATGDKPWGINFKRYIFRLKETSYLTKVGRDDVLLEKSAVLTGLEGVHAGKNVELFPYAGYRNSASGEEKDSKFAVGLDAKYALTSNLYLDATASPDFSEVETDPFFYQLTPYEYYLSEKRPFFQEAWDYFGYELFYTKRVTDPRFAFKLTGKEKGYTVGILGALNKGAETDEYLGVCNIKKDIFSLSSISVTYSGYKTPYFTNQNGGLALNLMFSKKTCLWFSSSFSFNSDLEKKSNGSYLAEFYYWPDEGFFVDSYVQRIEKNYLPRAGYYGASDLQRWQLLPGYSKRINKYGIKKITFYGTYARDRDTSGRSLGYFFSPLWFQLNSMKELFINIRYLIGEKKVQLLSPDGLSWSEDTFKNNSFFVYVSYQGSRFFTYETSLSFSYSPVYNRSFTQAYDGKSWDFWGEFQIKPTSFFNITFNSSYTKQNIKATGEEIFEGMISGASIRYQISRYVFVSSYIQHDNYYKRVNLDLLLGIELGMGNEIYLSYKGFYPFEDSPYPNSARSFVIKASYLIRL
jgi:hypothetical protein